MFKRHALAMMVMFIGLILGVIIAVEDSWKTGVVVGVIIVGLGALFAAANLYKGFKEF